MSLEELEGRIEKLLPQAAGLDACIKFDLKGEGVFLVDATEDPVTLSQEDGPADCTITIKSKDLLKMMDGKLDPMLAFSIGKLKVRGDMGLAMKLTKLFD